MTSSGHEANEVGMSSMVAATSATRIGPGDMAVARSAGNVRCEDDYSGLSEGQQDASPHVARTVVRAASDTSTRCGSVTAMVLVS